MLQLFERISVLKPCKSIVTDNDITYMIGTADNPFDRFALISYPYSQPPKALVLYKVL